MDRRVTVAALVVGAHLLVTASHGVVHAVIPVGLTPFQIAFVVVVIGFAPLVALWLVTQQRVRAGGFLLALSMGGSLVFGLAFHFVLATPDHVHAVPPGPWHLHFEWTAVASTLVDVAGLAVGIWIASAWPTADALTAQTASK